MLAISILAALPDVTDGDGSAEYIQHTHALTHTPTYVHSETGRKEEKNKKIIIIIIIKNEKENGCTVHVFFCSERKKLIYIFVIRFLYAPLDITRLGDVKEEVDTTTVRYTTEQTSLRKHNAVFNNIRAYHQVPPL